LRTLCVLIMLASMLLPETGWAFLLPAKKVLDLVAKTNSKRNGLAVTQTAVYYDPVFPGGKVSVSSRLYLKPPNKMRIESDFPGGSFIVITSGDSALTLVGNRVLEKNPPAIRDEIVFRDILLATSSIMLENILKKRGIEPLSSRITILDRRLAYIIGRDFTKDGSFLWVDHDIFAPLRIKGLDENRVFEVRFSGYKSPGEGPVYPDSVEFLDNGKTVVELKTHVVNFSAYLPDSLFDIDGIRRSTREINKGDQPFKELR